MRVCDRVHGEIALSPFLAAIATHRVFHRLDAIRQLGGCAFVYPSATHTRREHSIGVCHLAGEVGRQLQTRHPDLIDEDDVLCLQVAGLAHDLGHGPFSHTFESYMHRHTSGWSHEDMACALLESVFHECAAVHRPFHRGSVEQHFRTIEVMIRGLDEDVEVTLERFHRRPDQRFLFDIVHNHRNGIDVDKWDYLCRDTLCTFGASQQLSLSRLVAAARLVDEDRGGERVRVLAFDESVAFEMADMYALRARLHRQVYQHHGVLLVESLMVDVMDAIDAASAPEDRFHAIAHDPRRFATLVDASILCHPLLAHPSIEARYQKLLDWRRAVRTRTTAVLRTLPLCAECGRETELAAAFCVACGASTRSRRGVPRACGAEVAPACLQTGRAMTAQLCDALGRDDVRVSVCDVKCGRGVPVRDPHGRLWMDYDPLRCAVFVGKDARPLRPDAAAHHALRSHHFRTARCYVIGEVREPDDLAAVDDAFVRVCAEAGAPPLETEAGGIGEDDEDLPKAFSSV